ncbi:MAG TPA: energy transducer TonB [Kofleriaceae bacterium]|nr:energy transducer TonB [Kofleriaceae bacterium]
MRTSVIVSVLVMAATSAHADDAFDRAAISDGIAKVKANVVACGDGSKVGGQVRVKVTVAPDGKVTSAVADGSADAKLNACVGATVKTAVFKATKTGGSFSYPFVFPSSDKAAPAEAPTGMDRAAITDGVAKVKGKVLACGDTHKVSGKVKVGIKVAPEGNVTNVSIQATPDAKLGACVAAAIQKATFAKSSAGGSFSYPFVFGTATPTAEAPATTDGGDALDRAAISAAMAKVKAQVSSCAKPNVKGTVKLNVTVAPAGTVASTKVASAPDEALGKCVAAAVGKATFAKTAKGGSFSYPFVF